MAKQCTGSESDKKMMWAAGGAVLFMAMTKKTNEAMLQWYDRGLETLEIVATMIG